MSDGYEYKTIDGKTIPAHILVAEMILGRKLKPNEVVHHVNGIKSDNRPENLQVMDRAEHTRLHKSGISPTPETLMKLRESHMGKPSVNRRFNEAEVVDILTRLKNGESIKAVAEIYEVDRKTISDIKHGKNYKDIVSKHGFECESTSDRSQPGTRYSSRKLSVEDVSHIRILLDSGYSLNLIAKNYSVSKSVINDIREGRTYADIPKPELIAEYHEINDIRKLADIMLTSPVPEETDPLEAFKKDYHLLPSRNAFIIFELLQHALNGNAFEALLLYALSSYDDMIDDMLKESSQAYEFLK